MPRPTPMTITIYDPETDEVKASYTRLFVPWRLLKVAVQLSKSMDVENMTEADIDALAAMVVEVFGGKFSVQDLNDGADISEMVTVLQAIVAKARGGLANPTLPG